MKKEKNTDWIYYVFVFLSTMFVFTYILHVGYISSGSMEPALMTHDVTVSSRIIIRPIKCGAVLEIYHNEKVERTDRKTGNAVQ